MHSRNKLLLILLGLATVAAAVALWPRDDSPPPATQPTYVGRATCAECHAAEHDAWLGSHHDLAMQPANGDTVLGAFDGRTFEYFGITSTFVEKDGTYVISTDGPDGTLTDYPVAYTFGVEPLQQYLIEFPDGRYQAASLCWDSRPESEGGQRWFHLYPDEKIDHADPLHWTGPYQNWNFMCAECHSTGLRRNYSLAEDRYDTRWEEIDVSCEACHGPGSRHVEWARGDAVDPPEHSGFPLTLADDDGGTWETDPATGVPRRTVPRRKHREVEACARCHSRRSVIREPYVHGRPLMDTHLVSFLDERLYFADGQIQDEVYVYGSFLQSKMHGAGVTCGDCHDPHGLGLLAEGNDLCTRCHLPEKYDVKSHHFHEPGTSGASCVECHMASRTYMVVDPRRDHGFRVPRPDLSVALGTPNACNGCHDDESPEWAASEIARRFGPPDPHPATALAAGRAAEPDAVQQLLEVITNTDSPGIFRATALSLLGRRLDAGGVAGAVAQLDDPDPLVRYGALLALESAPLELVRAEVTPRLTDEVLPVRAAVARLLAPAPPENSAEFENALAEYVASQEARADRGDSHYNLGNLHRSRGDTVRAEAAYRTALRVEPSFLLASVNLADLLREQDRDAEGEKLLRDALALVAEDAGVRHALGLNLVRQGKTGDGIDMLGRAALAAPEISRYAYVYAIALSSHGSAADAVAVLEDTLSRHAGDVDILFALVTLNRDLGNADDALRYARQLERIIPGDARLQSLLRQLERP